jgi:hypothetical protein
VVIQHGDGCLIFSLKLVQQFIFHNVSFTAKTTILKSHYVRECEVIAAARLPPQFCSVFSPLGLVPVNC